MVRINLELVNHHIWVDTSHVLVGLGKVVMMLLKEPNESKVKFEPGLGVNLNFVVWKI